MQTVENELTIQNRRDGKCTVITVKIGELSHTAKIDILKSKARQIFIKELSEKFPGIDRDAVDAELDKIAESQASAATPVVHHAEEIDIARMVKSDRFITPWVSGIRVPVHAIEDGKAVAKWALYLRWADGQRGKILPCDHIELPDDHGNLWLQASQSEPTTGTAAQWSTRARQAWLNGSPAPDPCEVLRDVFERIAWFIEFPAEQRNGATMTLGLWVVMTYIYRAFPAVPYLYFGGPAGSGKSRIFEVLNRLVMTPTNASSMTGPCLFRTLDSRGGTLLLDEAEKLREPEQAELLTMLLAGYKLGGKAMRLEAVGDSFKPQEFDVFGPKALACIAGLPPALAQRCIALMMMRTPAESPVPKRRIDEEPLRWQSIRDDLHAMAMEHGHDWLALVNRQDICPVMSGRNRELWQPLLALAAWFDTQGMDGLLEAMQAHAMAVIADSKDEAVPEADDAILRLLAHELDLGREPTAKELLNQARQDDENFRQWRETGIQRVLKRYGFVSQKSGGRREYRQDQIENLKLVQARYGIDFS